MMTNNSSEVVVVGGGLAGLTAAAWVARAGHRVTVLERSRHVGGMAVTDDRNGFRFNRGPHALYRVGAATQTLTELGVRIVGSPPPSGGRVLLGGALHRAPAGPLSLLGSGAFGVRDKIEIGRALSSLPKLHASALATQTVREWIDATMHRPRPRLLMEGLVRLATYATLHDVMSAELAVGQIQAALGSGVCYLDGGWQSLVDQLAARPGVHTITGAGSADRAGGVDGALPDAAAVIVAVGSPAAAGRLVDRTYEVGPPADVSIVDVGLARRPAHDFVLGVDVPFYLSNHSAAAALAPDGAWSVSAMQYLEPDDEPDPDALAAWMETSGIDDATVVERRRLHRMTAATAIPTADQGGLGGRPTVDDTGHDNVFVAGDWVGPTGHLADAAVASGRAAADAAVRHLERRSRLSAR